MEEIITKRSSDGCTNETMIIYNNIQKKSPGIPMNKKPGGEYYFTPWVKGIRGFQDFQVVSPPSAIFGRNEGGVNYYFLLEQKSSKKSAPAVGSFKSYF